MDHFDKEMFFHYLLNLLATPNLKYPYYPYYPYSSAPEYSKGISVKAKRYGSCFKMLLSPVSPAVLQAQFKLTH